MLAVGTRKSGRLAAFVAHVTDQILAMLILASAFGAFRVVATAGGWVETDAGLAGVQETVVVLFLFLIVNDNYAERFYVV